MRGGEDYSGLLVVLACLVVFFGSPLYERSWAIALP